MSTAQFASTSLLYQRKLEVDTMIKIQKRNNKIGMPTLLIKTRDGRVFTGKFALHVLLCLQYNIDPCKVVACGFMTKDREVWQDRQPD